MISLRKLQLLKATCLAAILAANIFLFAPFTLYAGNLDEFATSFSTILTLFFLPSLFLVVVLGLVGMILTTSIFHRYLVLLATISVLFWLQGNILVWDYGALDGRGIDWMEKQWRSWLELAIWSSAILTAVFFPSRIGKSIIYAAVTIFSLQLVFFLFAGIQSASALAKKSGAKSSANALHEIYRFSSQKNVVHLILDGFQSDVFEEIIKEGEDGRRFTSALKGFVFFKEHMGVFPFTHMTIPAFLSGEAYRNHVPRGEFLEKTVGGKTILSAAHNAGYEVDLAAPVPLFSLYTKGNYTNAHLVSNGYHVTTKQEYEINDSTKLLDLVLFRLVPHFLKRHVYNDQLWLVQPLLDDSKYMRLAFFAHSAFLRQWTEIMVADRPTPVYKLVHLMLTHSPMVANENCEYAGQELITSRATVKTQAKCSLEEVVKLLEKMKKLGIYDDALIILMADHGAWIPPVGQIGYVLSNRKSPAIINPEAIPTAALTVMAKRAWGKKMRFVLPNGKSVSVMNPLNVAMALPLMAIKPPSASGPLQISTAPTSILDTPATIASVLGLNVEFEGSSAFDLTADASRERRHYSYQYSSDEWSADYLSQIDEFIIKGSVFDTRAWQPGDSFLSKGVVQER